jgi:hypothetical protein
MMTALQHLGEAGFQRRRSLVGVPIAYLPHSLENRHRLEMLARAARPSAIAAVKLTQHVDPRADLSSAPSERQPQALRPPPLT